MSLVIPTQAELDDLAARYGSELTERKHRILSHRVVNPDEDCWLIRDSDGLDTGYCGISWIDHFEEALQYWVRLQGHQFLFIDDEIFRRHRRRGLHAGSIQARCAIAKERGKTEGLLLIRSDNRASMGSFLAAGAAFSGRVLYSRSRARSEYVPETVAELLRGEATDLTSGDR